MADTALQHPASSHLRNVRDKFLKINRGRIRRTQECLSYNQRDFLEILPLLFHINHPDLPGYITQSTPAGLSHYSPSHGALMAVAKLFPGFDMKRRARHQMDIHALFCMGSSGTIAYTTKSDFDIWLIHSSGLSTEGLEELNEKARLIEEWSKGLRLEVHFFVFDDLTFKQGQHDNLSSESSGSAQHYLLLDEFYRSGLLIAGRLPVWWLVPPEQEHDYQAYVTALIDNHLIDEDDVVDFGDVAGIPADEFFGAAVWQLYKGIDSPYKSVLKLLLMEVYAREHPDIDLLSMQYKKAVYNNATDFVYLDPYIMMYKKIEEYLMGRFEKERLDLFRKCFYFKINLRISQRPKQANINWRRELLSEMVLDWGWDRKNLAIMDAKESWRINNVIEERHALIKAFTQSYQFLSDFARKHTEVSRVSQSELNVLGRKLYAAFERKAGKVEIINRGIAPDLLEPEITVYQTKHNNGQDRWLLYSGLIDQNGASKIKPLKRAESVIELLAWGFFNRIIGVTTAISLHSYNRKLSNKEIKDILAAMEELFPGGKIRKASLNDLNHPARINTACLFINVGVRQKQGTERQGHHLASSRIDALSYGGFHENLVKTFDLIVASSWEEILIYRFTGKDSLMQCLCDYLRWAPLQNKITPSRINAFSFVSNHAGTIARRIEDLFTSVIDTYYGHSYAEQTRYVIMIENDFFIIEYQEGNPEYLNLNSHQALIKRLAEPRAEFSPVIFDKAILWHSPIPLIYRLNKPLAIQTFFYIKNKEVYIYIVDERGSLFCQTMPFFESRPLINHFILFFASIRNRRNVLLSGDSLPAEEISTEYYLLNKNKDKTFSEKIIDVTPEPDYRNFFNIQVLGDLDDSEYSRLIIYCQDFEFSTTEFGDSLFTTVAEHVLEQRQGGKTYPIYITDIDLSRSLFFESNLKNLQSIHFLEYKKRIEARLNEALHNNQ
ncbi:MAG: class I adenylate cyclase [Gammaproteobacteria bacterium]